MTTYPSTLDQLSREINCVCYDGTYWARHGDIWIQVYYPDIITYENGNLLVNGIPGDIYAIKDAYARQIAWKAYRESRL